MKGILTLILLLAIGARLYAQRDTLQAGRYQQPEPRKRAWIVKWTPTSLMTADTPTMQLGLEYVPNLNGHWGFEADYGFRCVVMKNEWEGRYGRQYYKSRAEARYYIHPLQQGRRNFFLALESFYIHYRYSTSNDSYTARDNISYSYDRASVLKLVNGFTLKAGHVFKIHSHLWLETFAGLGIRQVNNTYYNVVPKQSTLYPLGLLPPLSLPRDNHEGTFLRPHVALGARVAYRF